MEIPKLNKRILQLIELKTGGSVNKFSKIINVSQPRMSRLFNFDKKMQKYPTVSTDIIIKVINIFIDINIEWLLTGKGDMFKKNKVSGDYYNNITNGVSNITGNNNVKTNIQGNTYISDSPDVLKQKINLLNKLLEEKENRLQEKDLQIKEKDSQINSLLQILKQK